MFQRQSRPVGVGEGREELRMIPRCRVAVGAPLLSLQVVRSWDRGQESSLPSLGVTLRLSGFNSLLGHISGSDEAWRAASEASAPKGPEQSPWGAHLYKCPRPCSPPEWHFQGDVRAETQPRGRQPLSGATFDLPQSPLAQPHILRPWD